MRRCLILIAIVWVGKEASAQFSTDQLQLRLGYNLHNAHARHFNHLIDEFNAHRYPLIIENNLPSINFQHGFVFGGTYEFNPDLFFHAVFKNRHQFIETQYLDPEMYRSYLFRANTLEVGATLPVGKEGRIEHLIGGGVVLGLLGVYTHWSEESGYNGTREMLNIDQSEIIGLSLNYEAQISLNEFLRVSIRPVAQYAIHTHVRALNQFLNPQLEDGTLSYPVGAGAEIRQGKPKWSWN